MRCVAYLVLFLTVAIDSTLPAQNALVQGKERVRRYGYVLRASKWPTNEIAICWEDLGDSTPQDRQLTRGAIENNWEAKGPVRFSGWETQCELDSPGIHIAVRDTVAETKTLGNYLDQMPRGMTLNFKLANWSPTCTGSRTACLQAIAVHEFGHALGFSHEQNRADAPDRCKERRQGANGDYFATEYDRSSIMNYCNEGWTGQGGLSDMDVRAMRAFYVAV